MNEFQFIVFVPDKKYNDYRKISYIVFSDTLENAFATVSETVSKLGFIDYYIKIGESEL